MMGDKTFSRMPLGRMERDGSFSFYTDFTIPLNDILLNVLAPDDDELLSKLARIKRASLL